MCREMAAWNRRQLLAALLLRRRQQRRKRARRVWVHEVNAKRKEQGDFYHLFQQLKCHEDRLIQVGYIPAMHMLSCFQFSMFGNQT